MKTQTNQLAELVHDDDDNGEYGPPCHLNQLGEGVSRTVYMSRCKKYVYKIGDPDCNRTEWNLYYSLPAKARKILAKPLQISSCGRVMQMEYVDFIAEDWIESESDFREIEVLLNKKLTSLALNNILIDIHRGNYGIKRSGIIKIIDYGYLSHGQRCYPSRKRIKSLLSGRKRIPKNISGQVKLRRNRYEEILSATR